MKSCTRVLLGTTAQNVLRRETQHEAKTLPQVTVGELCRKLPLPPQQAAVVAVAAVAAAA